MAKLEVYLKNERIESKELGVDPLSIGRKPDNDLVLHDLTVSRNHAELNFVKEGKYWQLQNKSATNPVKLNGEQLQKTEILFDGDHISIGTYTLIFRYGESPGLPPLKDDTVPQTLAQNITPSQISSVHFSQSSSGIE
ncbi:MAG: FHA domain-containing protein [bacterium]